MYSRQPSRQRLVINPQISHRSLKMYRPIAVLERQKNLIKAIAAILRRPLSPQEVPVVAVNELRQAFEHCRCLVYRCCATDREARIEYESVAPGMPTIKGETWLLADNPLFQAAVTQEGAIALADVMGTLDLQENPVLNAQIQQLQICAWLLVPIRYRGTLLGMLELHCGAAKPHWQQQEIALIEAIATQIGIALAQTSHTATDSEVLNRELATLDRMQSHLIAIIGHELWTPLSTIYACLESLVSEPQLHREFRQSMLDSALKDLEHLKRFIQDFLTVQLPLKFGALETHCSDVVREVSFATVCNYQITAPENVRSHLIAIVSHELRTPLASIEVCLESLANEPEMPVVFQQAMLDTALKDMERLHQLIQDFFTLSRLESGWVYHCFESIAIPEAISLALRKLQTRWTQRTLPQIKIELPPHLPKVQADLEFLVKVLTQLLDNACKFSSPGDEVKLQAQVCTHASMLEVIVADTGRGIHSDQIETIFDCFYQVEGWLRRTIGGTGLGLAICRQILQGMGGLIWAESSGNNQGSQFHFTIPIAANLLELEDYCLLAD